MPGAKRFLEDCDSAAVERFGLTMLKLPRFRGHPTFWVEGVHDVEAKATLPT